MASDVRNVPTRVLQCGIEGDLPEKQDLSIAILGARVHEEGNRNADFNKSEELFFGSTGELSSCLSGKMTPVTADEGDRGAPKGHVSPRRSPRNSRSKSDRVAKVSEVASNGGNTNTTVKRSMENVAGLCNGHRDEQPSRELMENAKIGLSPKTKSDLKLNGTSPPCANQCMSLIKSSPAEIFVSSSCGKKCHVEDSRHGNRTPCSNGIASSVVRAICFEETDVRTEECPESEGMALVTSSGSDDVSTEKSNLEENPQVEKTNIPDPDCREVEANTSDVSHETKIQQGSNKNKGKKRSSGDVVSVVPRKRRMASITAELKVNLMYEKDDWKPPKKPRKGKTLSSSSSDGEVFTTSPTDSSKLDMFGNGQVNGGFPTDPDQPLDLSMKKRPIAVAKKVKSNTKVPGATEKKQKSRSKSFPPQKGSGNDRVCGHTKRMAALNAQAIMTAYKTADDASQTKKNQRGKSKSGGGPAKNGYKRHQHATNFRLLCGGFNRNRTSLLASSGLPSVHARPPGIVSPVPSHPQTLMLTGLANLSASQILPNGGISPTTTDSAFSKFTSARLHNGVWYQTAGPFHQPLPSVLSAQVGPSPDRKSHPSPALDTVKAHNYKFAARTKRKKSTNGWKWQGEPYEKMVFSAVQGKPVRRVCYRGMCREEDLIQERDTVLLKSGPRKKDLPFVAKVTALWEDQDGEMMMSLLWYYRPEHIEGGKRPQHGECELFAARHPDENSVACIEDKCYVLTYSEFCRFRRQLKVRGADRSSLNSLVPLEEVDYSAFLPPHRRLPDNVDPGSVYFCRRVYDFRHGRMLKNPI